MKIKDNKNLLPLILVLWPALVGGQVITNEQAVVAAVREGVESNFKSFKPAYIAITVMENEISRPVEIGLTEGFENLGLNVIGNDNIPDSVQKVVCDVLGFDFKYEKGRSRGFLRKRMIKREFTAALKLTFSEMNNRIISGIKDITVNFEDQLNPQMVDLARSRNISALDPRPPSSNLKQVAEPVVVTAAVGVLIYLFFANR